MRAWQGPKRHKTEDGDLESQELIPSLELETPSVDPNYPWQHGKC